MDRNIRIDLTQVADLDPAAGIRVKPPRRKPKLPGEESVLEAALRFYTDMDLPELPVIRDLMDFKGKPGLRVTTVGTPKRAIVRPSTQFTIGFGPSASAGLAASIGVSGGIYAANTPELGFFGSFNVGVVTNASASFVNQIFIMFGTPSMVLEGTTIAVGINVGGPKVITGGGFLLALETPVKTFEYVGFGFQLGVGASVLPVDFTLTKSFTAIAPVLKF